MEILIRNSTPEAERNLEPAVLILREIMAKIVLENAIDSLAEPNFIYECIAKIFEPSPESETTSSDNIISNEKITSYDTNKEISISYEKSHPNTFKRNTLINYNNLHSPITFNNFNNKADENSYINSLNINEDSYNDYESLSETEYSESIYRMIKLDKQEEEDRKKKKELNRLSKTPGAFPDLSKIEKEMLEESDNYDDDQDYLSYYDTNYYNDEESSVKNMNSEYTRATNNSNNTNDKFYNNTLNSEKLKNIIQTEPPPSFYSSLISKIDINNFKTNTCRSVQTLYTNVSDKLKETYEKINNLLEFVRKPFNLFDVTSEKYNDYQLYKPAFDVINLVFQFSLNGTWIWKKLYSLLDFLSYFKVGQIINRSLIRGVGWILSEKKVAWYMNELSTSLWPDGHFIESKPPPTAEETEISRNIAQLMMKDSIPNSIKNLFGKGVIDEGFNRILEVFQNKTVNKHLMFILLDMIFLNIYPEHYNQLSNLEPKYIQKPLNMNIDEEEKETKVIANSQLERELLSASNEPLVIPNNLINPLYDHQEGLRERRLNSKSQTSFEIKDINKKSLENHYSSSPNLTTPTTERSNSKRRLRRVSNYIKYMLTLKPLTQTFMQNQNQNQNQLK